MTQRTTLAALRRSTALLAISIALFACSDSNGGPNNEAIKGNSLLLNLTSDYATGLLRWMNPDSASLQTGQILFDGDSKVFANGKDIFVLERIDWGAINNLNCIQADKIGDEASIVQRALDPSSNPYDIAIAGSTGYIALYDLDFVQTFDVNTCALGEKISLPIEFANASSIKANGNELLVVAQRLENYVATKPGLLIRINATTKALIDTIQLKFYNPSYAVLSNGKLYVSSLDDYSSFANAGIEVVDLATGTSEILVASAQLGGGASSLALDEGSQILYASVYISWGDAPVKPINLSNKAVGPALPNIEDAGALVFDSESGRLFIADAGGLKVYDNSVIHSTMPIGGEALPPYSLAIARW